jgi:phage tail sheath gpL-like
MAISFNEISSSQRAPGTYYEQDGSKALGAQQPEPHTVLIVGIQKTTGVTGTAGTTYPIVGETDGDALFGVESQAAVICRAFKRLNKGSRCFAMGVAEAGGGAAAVGTFPFTGTSSAKGTLKVRIGDIRVSVTLASGTTATQAGVALDAAIDLVPRTLFLASNGTGTVTLTCVHKGVEFNQVTIEVESIPAGLACTPVQPTGGTTNPTVSSAVIANMADERYDTLISGFTDATSIAAFEAEMDRRDNPTVKQPGMVIAATAGSHGTLTTYGNARNSQFSQVMGTSTSPTPPWIWAAQVAARDAQVCETLNPNRPRKGLTLPDCEAPKKIDRFDVDERNLLYFDGISSFTVDQSGMVAIDRLITTYQVNAQSLADATYLDVGTIRNLHGIYLELLSIGAKHERDLVAPDGTDSDPGVPVLTPKAFKGELQSWYESLVRRGRAKDTKGFVESLIVQINGADPTRLDTNLSTRLVSGLQIIAIKNDFQL